MTGGGTTEGTLLGGAIRYRQFAEGYRTGLEPVLLAAFVPAAPGARVVEAGCGAGAGLLCLAHRVRLGEGVGVERDPALAALANANFKENGFGQLGAEAAAIETWQPATRFDHALANPPWHDPAGTPSPLSGRRDAKEGGAETVALWARQLSAALTAGGTLSMVLPSALLGAALSAFAAAELGRLTVFPLWPGRGRPARLLLVRGVKAQRGPDQLLAGLVLHRAEGELSDEAERVLRGGEAIGA